MADLTRLCALAEIADGAAKEFDIELAGVRRYLFVVRRGDGVSVYLDFCPHLGYPNDFVDMRFLMMHTDKVYCTVHGACFRATDGYCTDGPPSRDYLGRFDAKIVDGDVYVGAVLSWPGREVMARGLIHT